MKKYIGPLLLSTGGLLLIFLMFTRNLTTRFEESDERYSSLSAVNLDATVRPKAIEEVLLLHGYVENDTDAAAIAKLISDSLATGRNSLTKVFDLNKRAFQMPVSMADSLGGPLLRTLATRSRINMGLCDSDVVAALSTHYDSRVNLNKGKGSIKVCVKDAENDSAISDVLVHLERHHYDTATHQAASVTDAFARTDKAGQAVFEGLCMDSSYSVVPVREGYEYGMSQGTRSGTLGSTKKAEYDFFQKEHRIRLFPTDVLKQIKSDAAFTVRTPEGYKNRLSTDMVIFLLLWWGLALVTMVRCRRRHQHFNGWIIPLMMFLSGFCMLVLYSISNPLTEELFGTKQLRQGILIGVLSVIVMQWFDFDAVKFYQNKCAIKFDFFYQFLDWLFRPFKKKVAMLTEKLKESNNIFVEAVIVVLIFICFVATIWFDLLFGILNWIPAFKRKSLSQRFHNFLYDDEGCMQQRLPKGSSYLVLALLLTAMLFVMGSTVGGMRVNISIGGFSFQPSEMAKYLMVIFMAAFFCENIISIERYSQRIEGAFIKGKAKMLSGLFIGIALLLLLYVALGDMGPGIVLTVTFVFFYSIVKSKVYLDNVPEAEQKNRIYSSDIFVLVVGVLLFIVLLKVFQFLLGSSLMWLGLVAWLVLWGMYCLGKKQLHETSLFMVAILSVFVFAGPVLKAIPLTHSLGERFVERNEMSHNPWGHLDLDMDGMCPAVNTQVGEGYWALASGGFNGQGLAQGNPNLIPAFHTDMILESVGEQLGWIGIALIVIVVTILLLTTLRIGYATHRRFAFFLCVGIAVVTAVQFAIITLGSTGMVPLTGITVPFLSYGSVSMIFNILAFGLVLALSRKNVETADTESEEVLHKDMVAYRHPVITISGLYLLFVAFLLSVFFHYQVINRNNILIKPLYVLSHEQGYPMVSYNPRIALLTQKMNSGNIYDRNGLLLATSTPDSIHAEDYAAMVDALDISTLKKRHQRRYYPFGDQLYFMIGDYNSGMYFSYRESDPHGYMAEAQHLSYLRGYDNTMYDADSVPIRRKLSSTEYRPSRFLPDNNEVESEGVVIRDYSALLPYLKAGIDSKKVTAFNEGRRDIKPQDIQLTLDARLQTSLQHNLASYVQQRGWDKDKNYKRLRISVAVLDAHNGDLLASANYPIPDQNVLRAHTSEYTYNDKNIPDDFKAYTERDLASTYATAPGSTAKVMSAMSALRRDGAKAIHYKETVYTKELIHNTRGSEPIGDVDMNMAIVQSSNCYFIHLVNHYRLYPQLDTIYRIVGARIGGAPSYSYHYMPYSEWDDNAKNKWYSTVETQADQSYYSYDRYNEKRKTNPQRMNCGEWQWCWGQGTLDATPLTMARVASIPINGGRMPITRYSFNDPVLKPETVISNDAANVLKEAMKQQTTLKAHFGGGHVGGKTGTPERGISERKKMQDGWYIFFIEDAAVSKKVNGQESSTHAPLAVAVRMERLPRGGSSVAMACSRDVVYPTLQQLGYRSEY